MRSKKEQKKLLAVASAGGHWVQLLRLQPAFEGMKTSYISTLRFNGDELSGDLHVVRDANVSEKINAIIMSFQVLWVLLKVRPDYIISTGALPGFAAVMFGRIFRIKTIWIDSIANAEKLSLSGRWAKHFATVWLTQWPNLSHDDGPLFWGSVL
ncbi:MAG: hypothetical protein ACKE5M_04780 [Methylophilaceae bacterium]